MNPLPFDERYINGLRNRDAEIEAHFVSYFKMPLWIKAKRQLRSGDLAQDAVQDTMLRVLHFFRSDKSLESPERLPGFVCKTCHNVTLEMLRARSRHPQPPELAMEPPDRGPNPELQLVSEERKRLVRKILDQLSPKDRELLQSAMLEEMDTAELCERFDVKPEYLRVLLYRARQRFREALLRDAG